MCSWSHLHYLTPTFLFRRRGLWSVFRSQLDTRRPSHHLVKCHRSSQDWITRTITKITSEVRHSRYNYDPAHRPAAPVSPSQGDLCEIPHVLCSFYTLKSLKSKFCSCVYTIYIQLVQFSISFYFWVSGKLINLQVSVSCFCFHRHLKMSTSHVCLHL